MNLFHGFIETLFYCLHDLSLFFFHKCINTFFTFYITNLSFSSTDESTHSLYFLHNQSLFLFHRFINTFCAIGSIFTLVVIAVDRYRKICKPLHGQMRMFHVRLSLIPVFGGALLFGWPAFFMYGLRTTETEIPGLFGQDCSTPDNISETIYPLLYNCILFLCFIILAVSIIIIYMLVLRETRRHTRYLKRNSDFSIPSSGQYNSEDSSAEHPADPERVSPQMSAETSGRTVRFEGGSKSTVTTTLEASSVYPTLISVSTLIDSASGEAEINYSQLQTMSNGALLSSTETEATQSGSSTNGTVPSSNDTGNTTLYHTNSSLPSKSEDTQLPPNTSRIIKRSSLQSNNGSRKKNSRVVLFNENQNSIKIRRRLKSKSTLIAFTVSVVFLVSFLPHLCLQVSKFLVPGFDYHLNGPALVAYNLFLRSYFINSVSNPFIYGVFNVHFSREVKALVKRIVAKS